MNDELWPPGIGDLFPDDWDGTVQIVNAAALAASARADDPGSPASWLPASVRLLNAQAPLVVRHVDDEQLLRDVVTALRRRYPPDHPVTLARWTDGNDIPAREAGRLDDFDDERAGHVGQGCLYVAPLDPLDDARSPSTLGYITARLRAPGGCPWDREQTHASLTPFMIEEAYEAVDAVERGDDADLQEELGDVLLQVVLHSQLAEEAGCFSLDDVAEAVNRKLVRRHPHVFGDVAVSGSSEVLRNWEQIKRAEKGDRRASALDGVPTSLPALLLAQTIGRKAAKLGLDWPDVAGVLDKVREELGEIARAADERARNEEIGDLLFALVSLCRHLDVDAESALRAATRKFGARVRRVEAVARERNLNLAALDPAALDRLWEEAKVNEGTGPAAVAEAWP